MKKIFIIVIIASVAFACSRKTASTAKSDIIISNKPVEKKESRVAEVNVEANAGKTIYTTRCTRCHGAKPLANYTAQQWKNILKSMAPKAGLTASETDQVKDFVTANAKK